MVHLPRLVKITPEGKIVAALIQKPRSYGELKSATGLSDRWLSKKLSELSSAGLVELRGGHYWIQNQTGMIDADPVFAQFLKTTVSLEAKAKLMAEELSRNEHIVAVILFGSVAKGEAKEDSDIDMIVVTDREMEEELIRKVYDLMFKYLAPVESISLTYDDLIINLQAKTTFSFGMLGSYRVLYDRGGVEGLLSIKKREVQESWIYDEEVETWIQRRLLPTLRPLKIN